MFGFLKRFKRSKKHNWDMEHPVTTTIDFTETHKQIGVVKKYSIDYEGFTCSDCGLVMWLDRASMERLPGPMARGCTGEPKSEE